MKAFLIFPLFASVLLAQAPAQTKTPPKAPAKTDGAATKAPAKADGAPKTATAARPNPLMNPAALRAVAPPVFRVKVATTHGDFVVEVTREWAPLGADRFYNLVRTVFSMTQRSSAMCRIS